MEIKIISTEKIKPSTPTPPHLRIHKLSIFDQRAVLCYIPIVNFYHLPPINFDHCTLKDSLSESLTHFYPLAGRKLRKDSISVDCNDHGVLYEEASVDAKLSEFLENVDFSIIDDKLLPFPPNPLVGDVDDYLDDQPLAAFRVTMFDCGGIAVGACMHHRVVDGASMSHFLQTWATVERESRGGCNRITKHEISVDLTSMSALFPPIDPFPKEWLNDAVQKTTDKRYPKRFVFKPERIDSLKKKAAGGRVPEPTRVEMLTAFMWKHMMEAAKSVTGESRPSIIVHVINVRGKLDKSLAGLAFGNAVRPVVGWYDPSATPESLELTELVKKVKNILGTTNAETLSKYQGENAFSYLCEERNKLMKKYTPKTDVIGFTSWCRFGLYEVDFGWGRPVWAATSRTNMDGVLIMDCPDNGVEAWVLPLEEKYMNALETNEEFLAYATPCPGIHVPSIN